MQSYLITFTATTTRLVERTEHWRINAADRAAATDKAQGIMRMYVTPPMFPPTLVSIEEETTQ